jgi:hypothetical protein
LILTNKAARSDMSLVTVAERLLMTKKNLNWPVIDRDVMKNGLKSGFHVILTNKAGRLRCVSFNCF